MNFKTLSIVGLALVAAASQASMTLHGLSNPTADNSAFGTTATTFATNYAGTTAQTWITGTNSGYDIPDVGLVDGWEFTATSTTSGGLGVVTVKDTFLPGYINDGSYGYYQFTADVASHSGSVEVAEYDMDLSQINTLPGWDAATNTLTFTLDLTGVTLAKTVTITGDQGFYNINPVPEPISVMTLGFGILGLAIRRKK